jgi:hypothetical protein
MALTHIHSLTRKFCLCVCLLLLFTFFLCDVRSSEESHAVVDSEIGAVSSLLLSDNCYFSGTEQFLYQVRVALSLYVVCV